MTKFNSSVLRINGGSSSIEFALFASDGAVQRILSGGCHGLSCAFVTGELAHTGGSAAADGGLVLAHLGIGARITAVREGMSIDTNMGLNSEIRNWKIGNGDMTGNMWDM